MSNLSVPDDDSARRPDQGKAGSSTPADHRDAHVAGIFADIARALVVPGSLVRTRSQVTELAIDVIPGCHYANIAIPRRGDRWQVVAATHQLVSADDSARQHHEGPMAGLDNPVMFTVDDFATDTRWPRLASWATRRALWSMCAIELATDRQVLGVLNLYGGRAGAFGSVAQHRAAVYGAHAALALDSAAVESRLAEAVATRQTIGQAVGILMERHDVSAGYAFGLIVKASHSRDVKIRDIAVAMVATGADPLVADVTRNPRVTRHSSRPTIQPLPDDRPGFRIVGAIEATNAQQLQDSLDKAAATLRTEVHVDVSALDYIVVPAVRAIIAAAVTLRDRSGRIVLHHPSASLARVLRVLLADRPDLDEVLTVEVGKGFAPASAGEESSPDLAAESESLADWDMRSGA